MKVEQQYNLNDRTIIGGEPQYDVVPSVLKSNGLTFEVIGLCSGIKPPKMALEIKKINRDIIGSVLSD